MVAHSYRLSAWEAEAGGLIPVWGQLRLYMSPRLVWAAKWDPVSRWKTNDGLPRIGWELSACGFVLALFFLYTNVVCLRSPPTSVFGWVVFASQFFSVIKPQESLEIVNCTDTRTRGHQGAAVLPRQSIHHLSLRSLQRAHFLATAQRFGLNDTFSL